MTFILQLTLKETFSFSAYLKKKVQFNDVDPDKLLADSPSRETDSEEDIVEEVVV